MAYYAILLAPVALLVVSVAVLIRRTRREHAADDCAMMQPMISEGPLATLGSMSSNRERWAYVRVGKAIQSEADIDPRPLFAPIDREPKLRDEVALQRQSPHRPRQSEARPRAARHLHALAPVPLDRQDPWRLSRVRRGPRRAAEARWRGLTVEYGVADEGSGEGEG